MPSWLNHLNQVREIQWGRNHLWDIHIEGVPSPFNEWFPAKEVKWDPYETSTHDIDGTYRNFSIPISTSGSKLSISGIPDDEEGTIYNFFNGWYNEIYNHPDGILSLKESVKEIKLAKLNSMKEVMWVKTFYAYPTGGNPWNRDGSAEVTELDYDFIIAGKVE